MKIRSGFVSNSSSSSFVCHTELSVEEVKEKLELIWKTYQELNDDSRDFDEVFEEPYFCTKEMSESEDLKYYKDYETWYGPTNLANKIVIDSASDNSIPYELFDLIESVFKGRRIHLG